MTQIRVSKLLADRGLCSRREADRYIEQGLVTVDGKVVSTLGVKAYPEQRIELSPAALHHQQRRITVMIHKTVGVVSHRDDDGRYPPASDLVVPDRLWRHPSTEAACATLPSHMHIRGLAPAGRLDIDSTGLLVMTQDGRVARLLIGEDSPIEKEYLVRVRGTLAPKGLDLLRHGLTLDEKPLRPAKVSWQNETQLRFVLREGRKRQIRRMCELVGLEVTGLKRIRIGRIGLGALPAGQWRPLAPWERF